MRRLKNSNRSSSGGRNRLGSARIARDVAEVEDAGILEEELALFGEEQAELREIHLLFVGFGLREVGIHREVERQRGGDASLTSRPPLKSREKRRSPSPRTAPPRTNGLTRRLRPVRSAGRPVRSPASDAR